jgi:hypothetical protein
VADPKKKNLEKSFNFLPRKKRKKNKGFAIPIEGNALQLESNKLVQPVTEWQ